MDATQHAQTTRDNPPTPNDSANKTLIKGVITGVLILVMLIPTAYISTLVSERENRQKEIALEVSGKWASSQTLSGPYLFLPYKVYGKDIYGKATEEAKHLWLLPEEINAVGNISHEARKRSIYKVLLYRAVIQTTGKFVFQPPKDIPTAAVQWGEARICYNLTDFKGIEERMTIQFKGVRYELSPGLPALDLNDKGLSVPVNLSAEDIGADLPFTMPLKIKGSEELHFIPLGGNSSFTLQSSWAHPSFDGNSLPTERQVSDSGFLAKWTFNKANLPFGTTLANDRFDAKGLAFGVTMLQPADQYAKTARSVKYAILFIGLTFSLFFVIELTQKKPVHPVQYALIGIALSIFYTLLLSISEFLFFDLAYLIASVATIFLITAYARSHFGNWSSAGIFGGTLSALYGFIFILIRLEDTALLVGSIGLFIALALVMFGSRKVNWYGGNAGTKSGVVNQ